MDPVLGLLAFVPANEINFGLAEETGSFPFNFEDIMAYIVRKFKDPGRSAIMSPAFPVGY